MHLKFQLCMHKYVAIMQTNSAKQSSDVLRSIGKL